MYGYDSTTVTAGVTDSFTGTPSGILYTWYMMVQGSLYWYIPASARTLLATWQWR